MIDAASGQYVLRRKPPGKLLKSAHAVDREFAVLSALHGTAVPVATPFCLCEDDGVIGSMFYVMSYEPGRIFWNMALPEVDIAERTALFEESIRVLAAIHSIDVEAVGLADYGKPGNYFARQLDRWTKQYRASETEAYADVESLIAWLDANLPADDGQVSLIHGDYRFDNIIFDTDQPAARAVLDWELSTLGHPLADLAYLCMCLRLPNEGLIQGLGGLDRAALGVPGEQAMIARYCAHRGIAGVDNWTFCLAFSFFRLAAIAQGVAKRAIEGNASSEQAHLVGAVVPALAGMAGAMIAEQS